MTPQPDQSVYISMIMKGEKYGRSIGYFKKNGVRCKKVDDGEHSFIAVFGYGKLTREEIVKVIRERDLLCMFFEGAIREDERNKRFAADK